MNRLRLDKWHGGISNDPNIGSAGSFFDGKGVEVRTNTKRFSMSQNNGTPTLLATGSEKVISTIYFDNSKYLEFWQNGKITNLHDNNWREGLYVADLGENIRNAGTITTTAGVFGFIIGASKVYKWAYDTNSDNLGIYSSTSVVSNGDFNSATNWAVPADWTITGGKATHSTGTGILSQTLTVTNTTAYRIEANGTLISGGTCAVKLGGVTIGTLSTTVSSVVGTRTTASTSETLQFVPSNDFIGSIEFTIVSLYNITSQAYTFGSTYAPYIQGVNQLLIGNGNKISQISTTSTTWVITDQLTIDLDFTIRGITKIGDQIFVYATNGSATKQFLWDGASTSSDRIITWIDKPVMNVANFANTDYIVTGGGFANKTQFWRVDGYQLTLIYQNDINADATTERIYFYPYQTNAIETIGTKLLIPGLGGVYTYGQFTPGLSFSLVKEYYHEGGEITAINFNESINYAFYYYFTGTVNGVAGTYRVAQSLNSSYSREKPGFLITNPYYGDGFSSVKQQEKVTFGYKLESGLINVYDTITGSGKYATIIKAFSSVGEVPSVGDIYTSGGNTYTVYAVSIYGTSRAIIECTFTGTATVIEGTFTKTSGSGIASFYSDFVINGYKFIKSISDTTRTRATVKNPGKFNENQIAFLLATNDESKTPYIYDLNIYYDDNIDD